MKLKQIVLVLVMAQSGISLAQNSKPYNFPDINFIFTDRVTSDSSNLNLKVVYKNKSAEDVYIYKQLEEGNLGDRFYNIFIEMQKKEKGKWINHHVRYYQSINRNILNDSLRHFDLPKKKLAPYSSDTLTINLLDVTHGLDSGNYRFRCHLRVNTILNESKYTDTEGETYPPFDEIQYKKSKWYTVFLKKGVSIH